MTILAIKELHAEMAELRARVIVAEQQARVAIAMLNDMDAPIVPIERALVGSKSASQLSALAPGFAAKIRADYDGLKPLPVNPMNPAPLAAAEKVVQAEPPSMPVVMVPANAPDLDEYIAWRSNQHHTRRENDGR